MYANVFRLYTHIMPCYIRDLRIHELLVSAGVLGPIPDGY